MDSTTGAVAICPEQDSNFRNLSNCVQGGLMAATVLLFDLGDLRRKWGWFLALGIIMIVFGMIALAIMPAATIGTVLILGWLMIFSGIVEAIHGFLVRRLVNRNCAAAAWLVARDDCSSASQLAGSAQRVAPRRVISPCPEPQSITP